MIECIGLNLERLPFKQCEKLFVLECLKEGKTFVKFIVNQGFGVAIVK